MQLILYTCLLLKWLKKKQFLSRLDAPDCVGKVLAHVFQYLKLRNAAESTHQKLQKPHICHKHHTSARVKFYLGCENFLFEHEKEHIFLLWAFFCCLEKLCGPHSVARCKTNEKYDVCSSEGAIRRVRLQSHLLI